MPSSEQLERLWNVSDDTLYPEAETFMQRLVSEKGIATLPASQVAGLQNIANTASYPELAHYIRHQCRERKWPESKKDIEVFYTELEKWFASVRNTRLSNEFHLVQEKSSSQEIDELMALLARDFIQHLVAENGLLAVKRASARMKRR